MMGSGVRGRAAVKEAWTAERVDLLRSCVDAGFSCAQIAREIGVTRNAVIGKIHRLGLSRARAAPPGAERTASRTRRPAVLMQRRLLRALYRQAPEPAAEAPAGAADHCSLLDLTKGSCRWPISDPGAEDFCFCGSHSVRGLSYCAGHARIAYRRPARAGVEVT